MKKIIITNNHKVFEKYRDTFQILFLEEGTYIEVLNKTRDKVHEGCEILTHPMAGSLKPNQTPFKSIIVGDAKMKTHMESVILIENSLGAAEKFLKYKATPKWSEKILRDFQTVDLSLIENVINNPMFNFGY
ncbi:GrdX family protein [Clostridium sp.]|uniref:GrdX family protein n=1 Tax=Clostridium sp. TaxID=1506 RepID=UPI002FC5CBEA